MKQYFQYQYFCLSSPCFSRHTIKTIKHHLSLLMLLTFFLQSTAIGMCQMDTAEAMTMMNKHHQMQHQHTMPQDSSHSTPCNHCDKIDQLNIVPQTLQTTHIDMIALSIGLLEPSNTQVLQAKESNHSIYLPPPKSIVRIYRTNHRIRI